MGSIEQTFDIVGALARYDVDVDALLKQEQSVEKAIASLFPKQVIQDAPDREAWNKKFYSAYQQEAKPALIFQPTSAKEVAIIVLLCRQTKTKFAVKSGGHASMKGASTIDDGIVIDLRNLYGVNLNEDKSVAQIGPGKKWEEVFGVLDKHGRAVAGGRAGDVGVGGYTLGGGLSFFASQRGWGCDNVVNYEFVTAEGEILNVTHKSNPDLYWALRGGGPNFGIVTRFDYETFPQGDIFAGNMYYEDKHTEAAVKAFSTFAVDADPKAATWLVFVLAEGKKLLVALAMYAEPKPDAALIQPYLAIPNLGSTAKVRSMANMVREIADANVSDHRQSWRNHTFKFDADFVMWLGNTFWDELLPHSQAYETKQGLCLVLQIYTKEAVALMQRNGGNCLGLKEDEAPYLSMLVPSAWQNEKDDDFVMGHLDRLHDLAVVEAKRRGLYVDYVYMNYAGPQQDVLKTYGEENYDKLKNIASKYDPDGVFQTLMPGYYKFGGAPADKA